MIMLVVVIPVIGSGKKTEDQHWGGAAREHALGHSDWEDHRRTILF